MRLYEASETIGSWAFGVSQWRQRLLQRVFWSVFCGLGVGMFLAFAGLAVWSLDSPLPATVLPGAHVISFIALVVLALAVGASAVLVGLYGLNQVRCEVYRRAS